MVKSFYLSVDKEDQYIVIASYIATNIGEISLAEGKHVTVIEKNERGSIFISKIFVLISTGEFMCCSDVHL